MKYFIFTVLIMSIFLTGCITVNFAPSDMTKEYAPRTTPEKIVIFRTQIPEKKFIEIGSVNALGADDSVVNAFRKTAAKRGGDALIKIEAYPGGMTATVVRFVE
jgi:hypothetical protein